MNMHPKPALVAPPLMSERRVSLIGALLVAVGPISMALFTPAMPEIADAFATSDAAVKMTLSLYFAGFALAQLVAGPLSDGLGRRPVTIAFMVIYFLASLVALVAPSIEVLIAARFVQGIGAAAGVVIARALVRDLFAHEQSARIMNLIGIILAIGPALAPTIGGATMEFFGWHAIFLLMALMGVSVVGVTIFSMSETVARNLSRIRPRELARSYVMLLGHGHFLSSSLVIAGTVGALYAQATLLPFVLMDRLGLSPTAFGAGMLMQSGMYFVGSLAARRIMRQTGAFRLVPWGLVFVALGNLSLAVLLHVLPLSFLLVMGPIGLNSIGMSFVLPAMMTATLAPFQRHAGAASSMMGFLQMAAGLVGGAAGALYADQVLALATIIPGMALVGCLAYLYWRRLPDPHPDPVVAPGLGPGPGV